MVYNNYNNNLNDKYNRNKDGIYKKINKGIYNLNTKMIDVSINDPLDSKTAIYKSYLLLSSKINYNTKSAINDSVIIILAKSFIYVFNSLTIENRLKKKFDHEFYSSCIDNLSNNTLFKAFNDTELLLIYFKQLNLIFRNANIFDEVNEIMKIKNSSFINVNLYQKLFNSFWNKTRWENLFPSMPDVAIKLKAKRKLLIDLMLSKKNKFRIDEISNTFFKITGIGRVNDLLLISFIDFYFFTWLSHFSIIKYLNGNDSDPVMIELTAHGRIILEYILSV